MKTVLILFSLFAVHIADAACTQSTMFEATQIASIQRDAGQANTNQNTALIIDSPSAKLIFRGELMGNGYTDFQKNAFDSCRKFAQLAFALPAQFKFAFGYFYTTPALAVTEEAGKCIVTIGDGTTYGHINMLSCHLLPR